MPLLAGERHDQPQTSQKNKPESSSLHSPYVYHSAIPLSRAVSPESY
jgi:hypothetical protein